MPTIHNTNHPAIYLILFIPRSSESKSQKSSRFYFLILCGRSIDGRSIDRSTIQFFFIFANTFDVTVLCFPFLVSFFFLHGREMMIMTGWCFVSLDWCQSVCPLLLLFCFICEDIPLSPTICHNSFSQGVVDVLGHIYIFIIVIIIIFLFSPGRSAIVVKMNIFSSSNLS
jgi:hypothetical protein